MDDTHARPPLTRGLSAKLTGGENCCSVFSPFVTASPCHLPHQREALASCIQHILNKNTVAGSWVVHKNMSNGANQFAVLYNRTAAHICVKCGTNVFCIFLQIL